MLYEPIRLAGLASSTRNTKPWKIQKIEGEITIRPDFSRWLPVDDPEKKQLYMSLGCALENLEVALEQEGWVFETEYQLEEEDPSIRIYLKRRGDQKDSPLYHAIEKRSTYRALFSPREVGSLEGLQEIGERRLLFSREDSKKTELNDLCVQADINLFSNPAFCKEFFSLSKSHGIPLELFIQKLQTFAQRIKGGTSLSILESAPALGLLLTEGQTLAHWVKSGQLLERLWLKVTSLGLRLKPYSICLREQEDREKVGELFNVKSGIPALLFCIGHPMP